MGLHVLYSGTVGAARAAACMVSTSRLCQHPVIVVGAMYKRL
jgi:hypothetical protein